MVPDLVVSPEIRRRPKNEFIDVIEASTIASLWGRRDGPDAAAFAERQAASKRLVRARARARARAMTPGGG